MSSSVTIESVKVHYFDICGRAQPIYTLLDDAGIKYEIEALTPEARPAYNAKKHDLDLFPFNQLPVVTVNGSIVLAQQDAILRWFSRVLPDRQPTNFEDETVVDMLACALEDLNKTYTSSVYAPDNKEKLLDLCKTTLPKVLSQIEHLYSKSTGEKGTLVGSCKNPTFPEYTLLYLLSCFLVLQPSVLSSFPLLTAFHTKMNAREGITGHKYEKLNGTWDGNVKICD